MEFAALGAAAGLVIANAFFVAVEFALVKVRQTQLEALAEEDRPGARIALIMRKNLDTWLSATQVGITLASLALGWVGEPAFSQLIEPLIMKLAPDTELAQSIAKTIGVVLAFATITFLHIVLGEQVPKTLAIARKLGWQFDIMATSFFLSRRSLKPAAHSGMPRWQDLLFIRLSRSANDATDYFQIPTGRVVEVGTQVTI